MFTSGGFTNFTFNCLKRYTSCAVSSILIKMAKKKKKHTGHFCRICHTYKANEKFSGKGHAKHICKACSNIPASKRKEMEKAFMNTFEVIVRDEEESEEEVLELPFLSDELFLRDCDEDLRVELEEYIEEELADWMAYKGEIPDAKRQQQLYTKCIREFSEPYFFTLLPDDELKAFFNAILNRVSAELKEEDFFDTQE